MSDGILSLLPPMVAIVLALATRRVLAPLALGILAGTILLAYPTTDNSPDWAIETLRQYGVTIWQSVFDDDHKRVLQFTLLLGAMVGVLEACGSMARMIQGWTRRVRTRTGGQTLIGLTGLVIFFDDYANTLLVGGTMRTTADRFGISRAKLAYLVDSTAAPVAGLTLVSTWVATEISYLQKGLVGAGIDADGMAFTVFLQSLPYRFYPLLAIWFVFVIARTGRDFGPMRLEEQSASERSPNLEESIQTIDAAPERDVIAAVAPIVCCLIAISAMLVWTGWPEEMPTDVSGWQFAGSVIGSGDSYLSLVVGGGVGLLVASVLALALSRVTWQTVGVGILKGTWQMMPAMAVLWLAWGLSSLTGADQLNTGGYLASVLSDRLDAVWLPTCVFVLAAFIAFSTGTSWGTMAILTPISVTLSIQLTGAADLVDGVSSVDPSLAFSPICLATFSSVLAGAIFGDHCSPLSDTTVLSSRACGCNHVLHVRTQLPYAGVVGVVCILLGTIPAAWGVSPWISLIASAVVLWLLVRILGRRPV